MSNEKKSLTLAELLNAANKGYPDGLLAEYFDEQTGEKRAGSGDTLAQFIVTELSETFEANLEPEAQIQVATEMLQNAIRDLQGVTDALDNVADEMGLKEAALDKALTPGTEEHLDTNEQPTPGGTTAKDGAAKPTPDYQARRKVITDVIFSTFGDADEISQAMNEWEVPQEPKRYLAIEYSSDDPAWAYDDDTLPELARSIDESQTSRDRVDVWDLDTASQWIPCQEVTVFIRHYPATEKVLMPRNPAPRVIAIMQGGLIQQFLSDGPVETAVIDYDTEGVGEDELTAIPQGDGKTADAFAHPEEPEINPERVAELFKAMEEEAQQATARGDPRKRA